MTTLGTALVDRTCELVLVTALVSLLVRSDRTCEQKNSLVESSNDALIWPVHLRFVLKKSIKLYFKTNLARLAQL